MVPDRRIGSVRSGDGTELHTEIDIAQRAPTARPAPPKPTHRSPLFHAPSRPQPGDLRDIRRPAKRGIWAGETRNMDVAELETCTNPSRAANRRLPYMEGHSS